MRENEYTLFWLSGQSETVYGFDIEDAFFKAGYAPCALVALDFYTEGNTSDEWEFIDNNWEEKK